MKSELPIWIQYVQALSLPALAIVASWIAYRQYCTAHEKLRLDLFDRRLEIYIAVQKFVGKVLRESQPDNEDFGPLGRARDTASFLFGPDIEMLLKQINDTAAGLRFTARRIEHADGNARQEAVDRNHVLFTDFIQLEERLQVVFKKYMSFGKIQ